MVVTHNFAFKTENIPASVHSSYETLIESHYEMALKMSFSFLRRWRCVLDQEEVRSITNFALLKAARKFDPTRGTKFSTLLYFHVRGELLRVIEKSHRSSQVMKALKNTAELKNPQRNKGLDQDREYSIETMDLIDDDVENSPEKTMLEAERKRIVREAIENLRDDNREIINLFFIKQEPVGEVAKTLGLSRSSFRRALARAKKALHDELESSGHLQAVQPC